MADFAQSGDCSESGHTTQQQQGDVRARTQEATDRSRGPSATGRKKAGRRQGRKTSRRAARQASAAPPRPRATARSKQDLVIVESPAKAKTINKYLGPNFKVLASYGHVRDLPRRRRKGEEVAGIDIEDGWVPTYVVVEQGRRPRRQGPSRRRTAKDILAELKREAAKANRVYLATDPDREGEAIAWHIEDALDLDDDRTFRITFNEITRTAVQNALAHPGKIDMDRVHAQEARRILDRVVGYPLSNLLEQEGGPRLQRRPGAVGGAAPGRGPRARDRGVQAGGILEDHGAAGAGGHRGGRRRKPLRGRAGRRPKGGAAAETARRTSKARRSRPQPSCRPARSWPSWPSGPARSSRPATQDDGDGHRRAPWTRPPTPSPRSSRRTAPRRRRRRSPPARCSSRPTSACTSPATAPCGRPRSCTKAWISAAKARWPSSPTCVPTARASPTRRCRRCAATSSSNYGPPYLPEQAQHLRLRQERQEAHEAIRPTDLAYTPERVARLRSARRPAAAVHADLPALRRQPDDAGGVRRDQRRGHGDADCRPRAQASRPAGLFKAQGKVLKFDGYRKVLAPGGKQEDATLPALAEKQPLDRLDLTASQHFTQPPPRYNEASLVKALEKEGIGRPSTYAIDHPQDHVGGARLHRGEGAPLLRHRDRQGGDRPAGRALPARSWT